VQYAIGVFFNRGRFNQAGDRRAGADPEAAVLNFYVIEGEAAESDQFFDAGQRREDERDPSRERDRLALLIGKDGDRLFDTFRKGDFF